MPLRIVREELIDGFNRLLQNFIDFVRWRDEPECVPRTLIEFPWELV